MGAPRPGVEIVDYDPAWTDRFTDERDRLLPDLAPWLAGEIEHIGSTAVPGLCAKPVIDIAVPVVGLAESRDAIAILERAHGYLYAPYEVERMHWLCKPCVLVRTHHLHLIPFASALFRERLRFRDLLRAHAELRARYAALKQTLACKFPDDRDAYTHAKTPFVEACLSRRS